MAKRKPIRLTRADTAHLFGVALRTFDAWAIEPIETTHDGRTLYDVRAVIKYRLGVIDEDRPVMQLTDQRTRQTRAKAEIIEIELATLKGKYLDAAIVERVWTDQIVTFKTRLAAMPARLAKRLVGKDFKEIDTILKKSHAEALIELSRHEYINGSSRRSTKKSKPKASARKGRKRKPVGRSKKNS